jgi:hypothetical protein
MAERAWNTSAGKDSRDFVRRQALTDGLLSRLIGEPKN